MREIDAILGVSVVCTLIGWIFYVISNWWLQNRRLTLTMEFHKRLLDRMGNSEEFGRFLESQAGQNMMQSLSEQPVPRFLGGSGVLRALQASVVFLMLSLAMFALRWIYPLDEGYLVMGILTMAVGLGLLLSSLLSYGLRDRLERS
ncbi:MAG TPA: hypothetical protein VLU25_06910 [Acidobacteriota bacterium]|nr:hypothetical protein [Acidobacteriota bacterium]